VIDPGRRTQGRDRGRQNVTGEEETGRWHGETHATDSNYIQGIDRLKKEQTQCLKTERKWKTERLAWRPRRMREDGIRGLVNI